MVQPSRIALHNTEGLHIADASKLDPSVSRQFFSEPGTPGTILMKRFHHFSYTKYVSKVHHKADRTFDSTVFRSRVIPVNLIHSTESNC